MHYSGFCDVKKWNKDKSYENFCMFDVKIATIQRKTTPLKSQNCDINEHF